MNLFSSHPIVGGFLEACTTPAPLGLGPLVPGYMAAVAEEIRSHDDVINASELGNSPRETSDGVRAAKSHTCATCDALIHKGDECLRTREGGFTTWRHMGCAAKLTNARGRHVYDCVALRAYIRSAK